MKYEPTGDLIEITRILFKLTRLLINSNRLKLTIYLTNPTTILLISRYLIMLTFSH